MTEHLLVVGASLTDDNFLRLAHEVLAFRKASHPLGHVLTFEVSEATEALWKDRFVYLAVGRAPNDDEPAQPADQSRRLAIFLDALAMEASRPAHVFDIRYENLLSSEAREVADHARLLISKLQGLEATDRELFGALRSTLEQNGA